MRSSRRAPIGIVAKGVDVDATLGIRVIAADIPGDGSGARLGFLLKGDSACDLGVTTNDSD